MDRLWKSLVFAGLLALAAGILLWLTRPQGGETADAAEEAVPVRAEKDPKPPLPLPVEEAEERGEIPLPEWNKEVIPGETTVFFTSDEAMDRFIEAAAREGLAVRGRIDGLGAVRVYGSLSRLRPLLGDAETMDYNYRISAPPLPGSEFWTEANLAPVGADLLSLLGVDNPSGQANWGQGVRVAVLDTGWQGHAAVDRNRVRELDILGADGVAEGEYNDHGTAVAGLIMSGESFAPGIAPESELLAVRVLDGNGQGNTFQLAEGILAAVDAGADVINMSLGGYSDSEILRRAVDYADSRGVTLVAASGNDGVGRVTHPAAYENVLGVTAVDAEGARAGFSNFGEGVDIAAPGYKLHALWGEEEFVFFDGTSAASAVVAGMAARVLQTGNARGPEEVRSLLREQANDSGAPGMDPQYGAGILDAGRLERVGTSGYPDLAVADLYPAVEQSDGASFPLYATVQNRGTDFIPGARLELSVNGTSYFYQFSGMDPGVVDSVQIPVPEARLDGGESFTVKAKVRPPEGYEDRQAANNAADITLRRGEENPGG